MVRFLGQSRYKMLKDELGGYCLKQLYSSTWNAAKFGELFRAEFFLRSPIWHQVFYEVFPLSDQGTLGEIITIWAYYASSVYALWRANQGESVTFVMPCTVDWRPETVPKPWLQQIRRVTKILMKDPAHGLLLRGLTLLQNAVNVDQTKSLLFPGSVEPEVSQADLNSLGFGSAMVDDLVAKAMRCCLTIASALHTGNQADALMALEANGAGLSLISFYKLINPGVLCFVLSLAINCTQGLKSKAWFAAAKALREAVPLAISDTKDSVFGKKKVNMMKPSELPPPTFLDDLLSDEEETSSEDEDE